MSAGLGNKFSILQQSPYDHEPPKPTSSEEELDTAHWVPSRYNVRATTTDGRLVLWNSYAGTLSVFPTAQKAAIEALLTKKGFEARPRGIVSYLFKRGFLVRAGTDEYRRIQVGFGMQQHRADRLELILLASEDCNFRCQYCYEDFARGTMQPAVRNGIKRMVEKRLGGLRSLSVEWFGGEPLYGLGAIEDLAPFFLNISREHSLRFSSSMTTNGYLLTPDVASKLLNWGVNSFQITLDGSREDHDRSRPTRDGQGSFDQIYANLRALRERPDLFLVDLRVNFDKINIARVDDLLDMVQSDFGGDNRFRIRFRAVGQWGGPNDDKLEVCGVDETASIQRELKAEARKRNLQISDDIRQISGMGAQVCYAARPYNFIIGATGRLMKCTIDLDKEDRNVVGQLAEDGELKIDFDKFALWTEPAFERDSKCRKCTVLPVCQGVYCPLIRIESGKSPCTPLRLNAKKELRAAVHSSALNPKTRRITSETTSQPRSGVETT